MFKNQKLEVKLVKDTDNNVDAEPTKSTADYVAIAKEASKYIFIGSIAFIVTSATVTTLSKIAVHAFVVSTDK